jgi:hypothetical protein
VTDPKNDDHYLTMIIAIIILPVAVSSIGADRLVRVGTIIITAIISIAVGVN